MKRLILMLALGLAALANPANAAGTGDNDTLRAALNARYEAIQLATEKRDGKGLGALLAPGFESISLNNESKDRDGMIRDIDSMAPKKVSSSASISINDVRQIGEKAFVDENYRLDRVTTGQRGKSRTWRVITDVSDTWIRLKGEWLLQKSVAEEADFYLDGIKAAHKVRGKKMRLTRAYKEKLKSAAEKPASAGPRSGGSCGGAAGTMLPTTPLSCGH